MAEASSPVESGCWVRIHRAELAPSERSAAVPEDTARVPLEIGINWDNMIDMYGKDAAHQMHTKTIGATSANYYQAIMKAIGLWDEFHATQDQYRCLGDGQCRMVYVRRSAMEKEGIKPAGGSAERD